MLLGTQTDYLFQKVSEEEGIRMLAQAGFDAIDYSMFPMKNDNSFLNTVDCEAHAKRLRTVAEEEGICFHQAHAPFPSLRVGDDEYNAKMPGRIARAVKLAGLLGAKTIVVHPVYFPCSEEEKMERNLAMYRALEPVALEYGIKVALENMWGRDPKRGYIIPNVCSLAKELAAYYDELNPDAFTVCLDLGHCGLVGEEAPDAIRVLGSRRIGALHVHDNNYKEDTHTLPYTYGCSMNWEEITKALGEIDYQGDFTFEADNFIERYEGEALLSAHKHMAEVGRTLMKKIDAHRPQK